MNVQRTYYLLIIWHDTCFNTCIIDRFRHIHRYQRKQHHSINDRLSNNQICIIVDQNRARYHDVNSMLSIISHPRYKPVSLLHILHVVLHECTSVPDPESAGEGEGGKYMVGGGSGQRRSYIHACMLWKLTFFWGGGNIIPFPNFCMHIPIWIRILNMFSRRESFFFKSKLYIFFALNVYFLC